MKRQILFDLDGTLTDSGEGIMHCFELSLAKYDLRIPTRQELRVCVGPPLRDSFRRFGVSEAIMEDAVITYRDHYNAVGQFENFPYPGMEAVLEKLQQAGHQLYVATSKPESMAVEILTRYDMAKYFTIICGATVDGSRNTKEAVIEYLLGQMDSYENLVMVGDTIYDVVGAAAHKIPTIAVTWGYGDQAEMKAAGATLVNTMDQLLDALNA